MYRVYTTIKDEYGSSTVTRVGRKSPKLETAKRTLDKQPNGWITDDSSGRECFVDFKDGFSLDGARRKTATAADPKAHYTSLSRRLGRPERSLPSHYRAACAA